MSNLIEKCNDLTIQCDIIVRAILNRYEWNETINPAIIMQKINIVRYFLLSQGKT